MIEWIIVPTTYQFANYLKNEPCSQRAAFIKKKKKGKLNKCKIEKFQHRWGIFSRQEMGKNLKTAVASDKKLEWKTREKKE